MSRKNLGKGEAAYILFLVAAIALIAFFVNTLRPESAAGESPDGFPITRDVFLLDTFCELTIYAGGGNEAIDSAVIRLNHYDDLFNKSKPESDISRINKDSQSPVQIDPDTASMLQIARDLCVETNGCLEPAIKPVSDLWDFEDEKTVPDDEEVKDALTKVKSLKWDVDGRDFIRLDPDVRIDVGAFAKGYIADKLKEDMISHGVSSAIINLGGNVLCIGSRPGGEAFRIAIKDPQDEKGISEQAVEISDGSVVTSGIYERGFEKDGIYYHHILDPKTGYPVTNNLESVTVTGPMSVICDCLSTALFVMGEEEGNRFIDSYNAKHETNYEVIFIKKE